MTIEAERDVYEAEPKLNIYEVLGVTPDVSPVVAQTMYWARIAELKRGEEAGDLEARQRISELNTALQIILDADRRADYDELGVIRQSGEPEDLDASPGQSELKKVAWRATLAVIPGAAAGMLTLVLTGEPLIAAVVAAAPVLAAALIATTAASEKKTPLDILELAPGATPDQVDLAYQTLVSLWLSRVGTAPEEVVETLDRLDRAYAPALEQALEVGGIESFVPPDEPGLLGWFVGVLGMAARQAGGAAHTSVRWLATSGLRPFMSPIARRLPGRIPRRIPGARRVLGRGATLTSQASHGVAATASRARDRAAEELSTMEAEEAEADSNLSIDLERRLRASVHAVTEQAADEAVEPEPSVEGKKFRLVLESAAGPRRIPVDERPVRIGNSESSDIMVDPEGEGGKEDTLIWVNGGELVLHTAQGGMACRVNGETATWARLDEGDLINIGGTSFRVEIGPEAA